jgi:hypothetical protein
MRSTMAAAPLDCSSTAALSAENDTGVIGPV